MSKRLKIPDSYTVSQILIRVLAVVLCLLFVVWAVRFVPPVVHMAF